MVEVERDNLNYKPLNVILGGGLHKVIREKKDYKISLFGFNLLQSKVIDNVLVIV